MISHEQAARVALALLESGVEGDAIIAQYVDEQSDCAELTDRELCSRALRRSDEAVFRLSELERRLR